MGNRTDQRRRKKNPYNQQHSSCWGLTSPASTGQGCIRIDVDAIATVQDTSEGVTSLINLETVVAFESRSIVELTSSSKCRCNVSRAHDNVALPSTSLSCDCVSITLDLEHETLELLNRPTSIGVNVHVEDACGCGVVFEHLP